LNSTARWSKNSKKSTKNMAKIDEIKQKLRVAVAVAKKQATERQINEAAEVLQKRAHVEKRDLRVLGEQIVGDPEIFASTDTDDMNNLLGRLGDK
jgi:hypothetical protein